MRIGIKAVQGDLSCLIISGRCPLLLADGFGIVRGFTLEQDWACLIPCFPKPAWMCAGMLLFWQGPLQCCIGEKIKLKTGIFADLHDMLMNVELQTTFGVIPKVFIWEMKSKLHPHWCIFLTFSVLLKSNLFIPYVLEFSIGTFLFKTSALFSF